MYNVYSYHRGTGSHGTIAAGVNFATARSAALEYLPDSPEAIALVVSVVTGALEAVYSLDDSETPDLNEWEISIPTPTTTSTQSSSTNSLLLFGLGVFIGHEATKPSRPDFY